MNTASQNLEHHFTVLQQKLQHATDYELALHYFLEEFAGDAKFIEQCEPEEAPHLMAAVAHTVSEALGQRATLEQARVLRLPQFGFTHGNAAVQGRIVLFFYFDTLKTGLTALIPGVKGAMEIARFRLTGDLAGHPRDN